jgi:hypothetical protein
MIAARGPITVDFSMLNAMPNSRCLRAMRPAQRSAAGDDAADAAGAGE